MDFAAGSGALAIAASGAVEYDGVAAKDEQREWLDSTIDRVIMYVAGTEKTIAKQLGGDDAFVGKVEKYFGRAAAARAWSGRGQRR